MVRMACYVVLFLSSFFSSQLFAKVGLQKSTPILVEGDIIVGEMSDKSIRGVRPRWMMGKRWKELQIPIELSRDLPNYFEVVQAIAHFHELTPFQFVSRTDEKDYLVFESVGPANECSSYIGRQGGRQVVRLGALCTRGAIIHELGHALGLYHEHTRFDRNQYITIHWDNIISDKKQNFCRWHLSKRHGSFDFDSIMLYSSYSFARDPSRPTLTRKDGRPFSANRQRLSEGDLATLQDLYDY